MPPIEFTIFSVEVHQFMKFQRTTLKYQLIGSYHGLLIIKCTATFSLTAARHIIFYVILCKIAKPQIVYETEMI